MRILLTGVTGFIGGKLAQALVKRGDEVHALVRVSSASARIPAGVITQVTPDGTEALCELMQLVKPEVVAHLASLFLVEHTAAQVEELVASNVLFGTQLLEAMRCAEVSRFLNTGTVWQHFDSPAVRPVNLYAATKQAFDQIVSFYHDAYDLSQITLKLCDTYGPGDPRRKLVSLLMQIALTGEPLSMSPGDQVVDLTHIDDVVSGFLLALDRLLVSTPPISATYTLSGARHSVKEVVAIVAEVTGRPLQVEFGGRPYRRREVMRPAVDCAAPLPGWVPRHDLRSGLRSTYLETAVTSS